MTEQFGPAIVDDVARLSHLNDQVKALTAEADSIKGRIRAAFADHLGTHEVAGHKVSVTTNLRFDETKAREFLPEGVIAACTVSSLSSTLVKKAVAPALYELCSSAGELRVSVA